MGCILIILIIGVFAVIAFISACAISCMECPYKKYCQNSIENGRGALCNQNQNNMTNP